jgi:hypothetical protein
MKERTSKMLLLVEALVCLVPLSMITGLYAFFLVPMYFSGGFGKEPLEAHAVPVFTLLGVVLQFCGWRVIAAFLIDGRQGIRTLPAIYIYAIVFGGFLVAISGVVVLILLAGVELPDSFGLLSANYLAVPALVPLIHVMIERRTSGRLGQHESI